MRKLEMCGLELRRYMLEILTEAVVEDQSGTCHVERIGKEDAMADVQGETRIGHSEVYSPWLHSNSTGRPNSSGKENAERNK